MIYFDNAATMPLSTEVPAFLSLASEKGIFNPSSAHFGGRIARDRLNDARETLSGILNATPEGLHFCSGATEAANLLLQGYANTLMKEKSTRNQIILSEIEHPAVFATAQSLKARGFEVRVIGVDRQGRVKIDQLVHALSKDTAFVSVMSVNNETGTLQPILEIAEKVKKFDPRIFFMTDSVQGFCKIPFQLDPQLIDGIVTSGHKIGALRGISAYFLNPEYEIEPLFYGGSNAELYRPGTVDDTGAFVLAKIAAAKFKSQKVNFDRVSELNVHLLRQLKEKGVAVERTIDADAASPYVTSLVFKEFEAHSLMEMLSEQSVCVSTGSACSSQNFKKSRVLKALGLSNDELQSTLRISFSELNTFDEIDEFASILSRLPRSSGLRAGRTEGGRWA